MLRAKSRSTNKSDDMEALGGVPRRSAPNAERLFGAGVLYVACGEWAAAYRCFERCGSENGTARYNSALCCFMVGWYEECYRLLCLAERLLADIPTRGADTGGYGLTPQPLPEAFRHWEAASELSRGPLLPETTRDDALLLILRLRAEAAFRLGRYEEVRTIATRLGHRYEQIENLLKRIDP